MLNKMKAFIMNSVGFTIGVLCFIYMCGWFLNGHFGTKFDLQELRSFIAYVYGLLIVKHGIDSGLNSPIGKSPNDKEVINK